MVRCNADRSANSGKGSRLTDWRMVTREDSAISVFICTDDEGRIVEPNDLDQTEESELAREMTEAGQRMAEEAEDRLVAELREG